MVRAKAADRVATMPLLSETEAAARYLLRVELVLSSTAWRSGTWRAAPANLARSVGDGEHVRPGGSGRPRRAEDHPVSLTWYGRLPT